MAESPDEGTLSGGDAERELSTSELIATFGGVRGVIESALPATVFVLVRLTTDSLTTAGLIALASGVLLALARLVRGQTLLQVGAGLVGLVIAVLIARATGSGEGFFLLGIISVYASGVVFAGSLLLGRPAVGYALAIFDPRYSGWREHDPLLRACRITTAFWAVTFFIRGGVATYVYQLEGDNDGLLLVVVNVVKWPLIVAAALLTFALVRKSGYDPKAHATVDREP